MSLTKIYSGFFSVSRAEERSNSLKTERETMFLKWACILKLLLIGGKTVSSKVYYIFVKVLNL